MRHLLNNYCPQSFLYVDFLDTSGTLLALVSSMGLLKDGAFPKNKQAFAVDGAATVVGAFFGLSPVTCYIESGAGVEAGSRTGLTACFCGCFFFLSIFFAPIIASIPPWATGGALIIVGALMTRSLRDVQWNDPAHAISAFLTFIIMPLTYSIGKYNDFQFDEKGDNYHLVSVRLHVLFDVSQLMGW